MEHRHEETLSHVVQVLPHGQYVVALPPGAGVQPPALHSGAETANGGAFWQGRGLLEDACGYRGSCEVT